MRIIELDAGNWTTVIDFCEALLAALGAPEWHGESIDALIDSMIWGGINDVEPPYTVRICSVRNLPKDVLEYIEQLKSSLARARAEFNQQRGHDVDVQLDIVRD
jgi:hypothetical protein